MKETAKLTNISIKLSKLREVECSLGKSVSIFIEYCLENFSWLFWGFEIVECNLFSNSLMGTTIQDSRNITLYSWITFI